MTPRRHESSDDRAILCGRRGRKTRRVIAKTCSPAMSDGGSYDTEDR